MSQTDRQTVECQSNESLVKKSHTFVGRMSETPKSTMHQATSTSAFYRQSLTNYQQIAIFLSLKFSVLCANIRNKQHT